jgi:hypothetical protein
MSGHRFLARASILALTAVAGLSCSTVATIERRSGPTLAARIDGSDSERLYVTDSEDARYTIESTDIVEIHHPIDIDHPGTGLQIAGALLALMGVYFVANSHTSSLSENAILFACTGGPGLGLLTWGTWNNLRSRRAARNLTREKERIWNARPYLPAPTEGAPLLPPAGLPEPAAK